MLVLRHPSDTITAEFNRQRDIDRELDSLWDLMLGTSKVKTDMTYWEIRNKIDRLRSRPDIPSPEWNKREFFYAPPSSDIVCHCSLPDSDDPLFDGDYDFPPL